MKIKITADSTCDLSPELIEKYNVDIMPLFVALGDKNLLDGETITPEDIYEHYQNTKQLPKSGSRNIDDYEAFFKSFLDEGYDAVIHFNISSEMSASYNSATTAASRLKNVYTVDSHSLSTGTALLALDACDMVEKGMSAQDIVARENERKKSVQASFIINSLEFLFKGGRCSSLAYFGANLLHINPSILVTNGKMDTWKKHIGHYKRCVDKYINTVRETFTTPDKTRCFITHTKMDDGIAQFVVETVKSWGIFDEVFETIAGCTVTSHCGANTIGVLFLNDGGAN